MPVGCSSGVANLIRRIVATLLLREPRQVEERTVETSQTVARYQGMKRASEYRKHAADCRDLAGLMKGEHREQLLSMAATWDSLAEERERLPLERATFENQSDPILP